MDTPKLSEAMRAGAKLRPQSTSSYTYYDQVGGGIWSCALGAAYEGATGIVDLTLDPPRLFYLWPELRANNRALHQHIVDRNDGDKWTREQIADWLEAQGL